MSDIIEHLPNGYQDLKDAGCEEPFCDGDGYALFVGGQFETYLTITCEHHYKDYRGEYDFKEIFTVDEQ